MVASHAHAIRSRATRRTSSSVALALWAGLAGLALMVLGWLSLFGFLALAGDAGGALAWAPHVIALGLAMVVGAAAAIDAARRLQVDALDPPVVLPATRAQPVAAVSVILRRPRPRPRLAS